MSYEHLIVETQDAVGVIRLNRPKALNALSTPLTNEIGTAIDAFEADRAIGAIVITGNEKSFAAGADIREMQDKTFAECYLENFITATWERVAHCRLPVIAAVSGFALGGGCELAMMCDVVIAAENAKFGQPEINLGVIPGAGGTQRLTRFVGKAKAMDLVLTGRFMGAEEAQSAGLVSRVVSTDRLMEEAMEVAATIASKPRLAAMLAKESVNKAFETTLAEGIQFERRMFHALFATDDQKEGMSAFAEKRDPRWKNS